MNDLPDDSFIDIVITMNQTIPTTNDHAGIRNFRIQFGSLLPKADTRLPPPTSNLCSMAARDFASAR